MGRVAAFTTCPDLSWGEAWLFERLLWERMVQWLMGPALTFPFVMHSEYTGKELILEAWAKDGSARGLNLLAEVTGREGQYSLKEVLPGLYRGNVPLLEKG